MSDETTRPNSPLPGESTTPSGSKASNEEPATVLIVPASEVPPWSAGTTSFTKTASAKTAPTPADPGTDGGAVAAGPVQRGVRVRTVVFGLVMAVISGLALVSLLTHLHLDGTVVLLAVLIGAGAALVYGGIAAALRESRGGPGATR